MKREEPDHRLPWQVQQEITQAEHLMAPGPWQKVVQAGGRIFLNRS